MIELERRFKHMPMSSVKELSSAIIKQAINDYMNAIIQDDIVMISDCERFFLEEDGWFDWLTNSNVSGKNLIEIVKQNVKTFIKGCKENQPEKFGDQQAAEKASFTCTCCKSVPVKVTYDKRNTVFPQVIRYTCSNCHITLRMAWHGDVLPRELNCVTCKHCLQSAEGLQCMRHDKPVKRLPKNCDDWERRQREEAD